MTLPTITTLDLPVIVLGGMLALLTLALARKLYRCARTKLATSLLNSSDGKSP